MRSSALKTLSIAALLCTCVGCSVLGVYTIDLPQGTPISYEKASQIRLGMNKNQVQFILGSPAIQDTLAPNRWDYLYDYEPGTDGKRRGETPIHNRSQHLAITFNESGLVSKIEGINSLPKTTR